MKICRALEIHVLRPLTSGVLATTRRVMNTWLVLAMGLLAWGSSVAAARDLGVFELVEGKGVEVCEACLKDLQTTPTRPALKGGWSGCERQYADTFGLAAPAWTDLDPLHELPLLKRLMLFLQPMPEEFLSGSIYDGENFREAIQRFISNGQVALAIADLDITNDGTPEPVVKVRRGACGLPQENPVYYQALVVLTQDRTSIDLIKTDLLTQNAIKGPGNPTGHVYGQIYDVFRYNGSLWFDKWDNDNLDPFTFSIFRAEKGRVTRVCTYRFDRSKLRTAGGAR